MMETIRNRITKEFKRSNQPKKRRKKERKPKEGKASEIEKRKGRRERRKMHKKTGTQNQDSIRTINQIVHFCPFPRRYPLSPLSQHLPVPCLDLFHTIIFCFTSSYLKTTVIREGSGRSVERRRKRHLTV